MSSYAMEGTMDSAIKVAEAILGEKIILRRDPSRLVILEIENNSVAIKPLNRRKGEAPTFYHCALPPRKEMEKKTESVDCPHCGAEIISGKFDDHWCIPKVKAKITQMEKDRVGDLQGCTQDIEGLRGVLQQHEERLEAWEESSLGAQLRLKLQELEQRIEDVADASIDQVRDRLTKLESTEWSRITELEERVGILEAKADRLPESMVVGRPWQNDVLDRITSLEKTSRRVPLELSEPDGAGWIAKRLRALEAMLSDDDSKPMRLSLSVASLEAELRRVDGTEKRHADWTTTLENRIGELEQGKVMDSSIPQRVGQLHKVANAQGERFVRLEERVAKVEAIAPGQGELVSHGSRIQMHDERITKLEGQCEADIDWADSVNHDLLQLNDVTLRLRMLEQTCFGNGDPQKAVALQTLVGMAVDARDRLSRLEEGVSKIAPFNQQIKSERAGDHKIEYHKNEGPPAGRRTALRVDVDRLMKLWDQMDTVQGDAVLKIEALESQVDNLNRDTPNIEKVLQLDQEISNIKEQAQTDRLSYCSIGGDVKNLRRELGMDVGDEEDRPKGTHSLAGMGVPTSSELRKRIVRLEKQQSTDNTRLIARVEALEEHNDQLLRRELAKLEDAPKHCHSPEETCWSTCPAYSGPYKANSEDCGGECHADCDPYPACDPKEYDAEDGEPLRKQMRTESEVYLFIMLVNELDGKPVREAEESISLLCEKWVRKGM